MKKKYYLLAVEGGVEPFVQGPYEREDERDHAAKLIHPRQEEDGGLFWADIDDTAGLTVGSYAAWFFWED